LVLDHDARIDERSVARAAGAAGDRNDPIDAFGRGHGAVDRRMAVAAAGFLFPFLDVAASEGTGLPLAGVPGLRQFAPQPPDSSTRSNRPVLLSQMPACQSWVTAPTSLPSGEKMTCCTGL
jgi:hypothetical protein